MKISDLIKQLEREMEKHGDVDVTMTATYLREGYCQTKGGNIPDVFESTVETLMVHDKGANGRSWPRVKLYWQY